MKSAVSLLLKRVRDTAVRRAKPALSRNMGRERKFWAWDSGADTFVFEEGVASRLGEHSSVLLVSKRDLVRGAQGFLMTVTTGNHAVAALPLLSGAFWDLSRVPPAKRGEALTSRIVCANVVGGSIEISQREVPFAKVAAADRWLQAQGLGLAEVVFAERTASALDHYRRLGQEWRVKPLAWTRAGMDAAIAAARKRISSSIRYYHSSRGVHFLTYAEFHALCIRARESFDRFAQDLRELVGVPDGSGISYVRQPKYRGHHEVEFFGLARGAGTEILVPRLERLMERIVLGRISHEQAAAEMDKADALCKSMLLRPSLADPQSMDFTETLYMNLTGEVYAVAGEDSAPAFDDHRIALPGATYENGVPHFHPGIDDRSKVLLSSIRWLMNKDEKVEYANVYDLRGDPSGECDGDGTGDPPRRSIDAGTREIVYKTNMMPLPSSLVEKRLAQRERGYGSYLLARVEAFRALGVNLCDYRLLRRAGTPGVKALYFYLRTRCAGHALSEIPPQFFQKSGEFGGDDAGEDPQVVRALAVLMGDAAAQNLALKKYDYGTGDCRFGVGKEIYEFGYDLKAMRLMPKRVSFCSLRGTLGWPDLSRTEENLSAMFDFYVSAYAEALYSFHAGHPIVPLEEAVASFLSGFEYRSRAMEWKLATSREQFESFSPDLRARFDFHRRWLFALWALDRQVRRLSSLGAGFREKTEQLARLAAQAAGRQKQ